MRLARPLALVTAPLAVGAAIATAQQPRPKPMTQDAITRAILVAKSQFDTAASKGDLDGMARWFAEDAIVIRGRDTLKGRTAVTALLRTGLPGATAARVYFQPAQTEFCTDGAYEYGGEYTIHAQRLGGITDTLRGRYALRWTQHGADAVLVQAVAVAPTHGSATPALRGCAWATHAAFDRRRIRLSFFTPAAISTANTVSSLEGTLRDRGYGPGFTTQDTDFRPTRSGPTPWLIAGARVRLWRGVSVEGLFVFQPRSDSIQAYNASTGAYIQAWFKRSSAAAAVLGYEWRRLRVGVGPTFLTDAWTIQESTFPIGARDGALPARATPEDSWTERRRGLLLEVAYTVPVTPHAFVELRAQQWSVKSTAIHPTHSLPTAYVDTSGRLFVVTTGLAF
jgi:ketosteroid isomerase-like protein